MVIEIGPILQDFTIIMIAASIMAMVSYKLKQPMVIGYIIAGMIIGPFTPPFSLISNFDVLNLFAEIGIILLLFVVGMEFPIEKLRKIGKRALVIAFSEGLGTFGIGFLVCQAVNYSLADSLFLALAISVTSTVIVMRILDELGMIKDETSIIILGVAVIEDIIIISMLAILQSVSSTGGLYGIELVTSIGTVLAFIGGALFIGSKTVPKFVNLIGKTNQHDVLVVAILGVAFGLSFLAFEIGISVATGAFFAGVLIAESKVHSVTRVLTTPLKDMFGAIFFVSIGALMDITKIPALIIPALMLIVVSIGAKFLTVYLSSRSQGYDTQTSLKTAFGLSSSGGELALVVAKGGADVGTTSSFVLPMVGTMTIITTFITPYLIKIGWKLVDIRQGSDGKFSFGLKRSKK
ncbi:MAG TPA: cation:proton antiporter [Nitrososphaeraceae archaeon]|jgi:CPA2 family monovalent cation:H+ antiporter-2|nr:cation:proton antiporter [Nitrososphaeraceae archaeon]